MTIKGVIWDMDGVLIDTGDFHFQAWSQTLDAYKIPFSYEKFHQTFGMNNWSILTLLLGSQFDQEAYTRISAQKEACFRQVIRGRARLLPGVLETLDFLRSRGVHQAIASCAPPENIDTLVDELHIRGYFEAIVSGIDIPGKPAPDVFLAAARGINLAPHDCLVVEDAITGVTGAGRAGMTCLAITNTHPAENLRQAHQVVGSLLEVGATAWQSLLDCPS